MGVPHLVMGAYCDINNLVVYPRVKVKKMCLGFGLFKVF